MFKTMSSKIEKTKTFASEHKMMLACVTTAAVTVVLTHKVDLRMVKMLAEVGGEHTSLSMQRDVLLAYINENDLGDQVREYVLALKA